MHFAKLLYRIVQRWGVNKKNKSGILTNHARLDSALKIVAERRYLRLFQRHRSRFDQRQNFLSNQLHATLVVHHRLVGGRLDVLLAAAMLKHPVSDTAYTQNAISLSLSLCLPNRILHIRVRPPLLVHNRIHALAAQLRRIRRLSIREHRIAHRHQTQPQIAVREHIDVIGRRRRWAGRNRYAVHVRGDIRRLARIQRHKRDLRRAAAQIESGHRVRAAQSAEQKVDGKPREYTLIGAVHDFDGARIGHQETARLEHRAHLGQQLIGLRGGQQSQTGGRLQHDGRGRPGGARHKVAGHVEQLDEPLGADGGTIGVRRQTGLDFAEEFTVEHEATVDVAMVEFVGEHTTAGGAGIEHDRVAFLVVAEMAGDLVD